MFRTPFGKLTLDSPQLYHCPCESQSRKSFSPLAELLPKRTSPELVYLESKFSALVWYGLTIQLLNDVLPIGDDLSTRTIRRHVRHMVMARNARSRRVLEKLRIRLEAGFIYPQDLLPFLG